MGSLPESAQVVIVGGGVVGTSVAYHLAQQGWQDIVLVDQGPLWETGGSSSHAPGGVFQLNPSPAMTHMAQDSIALFKTLSVDGQPAYHQVGGIEVARDEPRWEELHRRLGRARSYGVNASLLTPEEVKKRSPLINPDAILGALSTPEDGIADGVVAAEAMAADAGEALRAYGLCEVVGLEVAGGYIRAVETSQGTIRAEHVVLCAGIWGPKVARLAGANVSLIPVEHQYAVTEPLPELAGETRPAVHALLRHQDHAMYFRQHADAYGIGNYRHEPRVVEPEAIRPPGGEVQPAITPFTPEDFVTAAEETRSLFPAVGRAKLARSFNGMFSFTPDGMPLIGESATAKRLWLCEAIWVTHSGGAGKALAELMTHGDVRLDMHECDPERYEAHGTSRAYARARGAQQYREVYDVIHPRQPSEQARGLRRSPFYEREAALGAVFFESAGWERPQWYEANADLPTNGAPERSEWSAAHWSPIAIGEHLACRERAGLFDLTAFTKVEVSGPGAAAFVQRLAANDVDKAANTIVYTAMLAPRGGIMCDLTVTRLAEDRFLVVTGGAVGRHDIAWMRRNLPEDGSVHLEDRSSGTCCVGLWGPRARDIAEAVSEEDLSNEAFGYMRSREAHIGYVPVRMLRISYAGELGWEIYAPTEFGPLLWDTLWAAGQPHGLIAVGGAAYDSLRLEKGYRLWGADIDEDHDPIEAGLGWAVKLDKGDFIGRETVERIKAEGISQKLCCLVVDDPGVVAVGKEPILAGEERVGWVTSAGYGPSVGESLLYAYLPVEHAEAGTALEVMVEGERTGVTVAEEPRFDPRSDRMRDVTREPAPA